MNLKHIGGVLTPGEEFVCFRCRVGWNGLNTRLARRNVQTEGQVLASLGNILDSVPIPSRTKKSTPGAAVPRPRTWEGKARRFISREFVAPEAAKDSQEEVSVCIFPAETLLHLIICFVVRFCAEGSQLSNRFISRLPLMLCFSSRNSA